MLLKKMAKIVLMIFMVASPAIAQDFDRQVPTNAMEVKLSYAPLVKAASPAVVNIYTRKVIRVQNSSLFSNDFFRQFFGDNLSFGVPKERVTGSLGSGVIVRDNGVIVTNNHVIAGADQITVVLSDRREYAAEVVLADEGTDLAVLRIQAGDEKLPTIDFTDSDKVLVGDIVLAIGNPFGVGQSVTGGIVSATARTQQGISDFGFFIQTDAAINPGNSGGALIGVDGKLIGINSAIYSRTGTSNGIGFAIPANMVDVVLNAAITNGTLVRPWLGIEGQNVTTDIAESLGLDRSGGVIIGSMYAGGPADVADLEAGDVILAINDFEIIDEGSLNFRIATRRAGEEVLLTVLRNGETILIPATLALPPEDPARDIILLDGRHPFQGIEVANLSPRFNEENRINPLKRGVMVTNVESRSPAARTRFLVPGDILLELNGTPITSTRSLNLMLTGEADIPSDSDEPKTYIFRLDRGGEIRECGIRGNSLRCGVVS